MKAIFTIALFLFASIVSADVGPSGFSNSMSNAGTVKHSEKHFIYMKSNAGSGAALAAGDVVVPDTSADDGVSFTTSATAGAFPVGVLAEACSQGQLCRLQTYGLGSVNFDVGTTAAPKSRATAGLQAFISEANGGKVQAEAVGSYAAGDIPIGIFMDTQGVSDFESGSQEVFIRLR